MVLERREEPNDGATVNFLSPKSKKMKKVPQRGLGVAQLERLRIEEQQQQQKNNPTATPASSSVPPLPPPPPPLEPKQPSLHQSPSAADLADLFQPRLSFDSGSTVTSDASNPIERFGTPRLVSQQPGRNQQYFPNIALAKGAVLPSWLSSGVVHHHHHQMELPSKQVVDLQMEPPSNQIYRSYIQTFSSLTEEERNVDDQDVVVLCNACFRLVVPDKFYTRKPILAQARRNDAIHACK